MNSLIRIVTFTIAWLVLATGWDVDVQGIGAVQFVITGVISSVVLEVYYGVTRNKEGET